MQFAGNPSLFELAMRLKVTEPCQQVKALQRVVLPVDSRYSTAFRYLCRLDDSV